MKKFTHVTEPHLPPLESYVRRLDGIWDRCHLTNNGPLIQELEQRLLSDLESDQYLHCVANGGLALQLLLRAMDIRGEIITTPYSYVATSSCAIWEGCTPVFADIDPHTLCIDPQAVEAMVTPSTKAVLATHVFGNPCDVDALETICSKHSIPLLFDAAHAFGVTLRNRSILNYGDASIMSLHATKLVHSVEGGFVTTRNDAVATRVEWMRRFGHDGFEAYHGAGINAKMSELHAAMALCVLDELDKIRDIRERLCGLYHDALNSIETVDFAFELAPDTAWNHCYMPVRFNDETTLLKAVDRLESAGYGTRRYFYPTLDVCKLGHSSSDSCAVAHDLAKRILCLPLSTALTADQVYEVTEVLEQSMASP